MNFPCQRPKLQPTGTIPIVCNMLAIKSNPTVHSYLVTFTPELKRDLHTLFMKVASEPLKGVAFAFDGINQMVTNQKIPDTELKFLLGKEKEFVLKLVYKHSSNEEALSISMYETIIKHYQQMNFFAEGKRSFNKAEVASLSGGIELHGGLAQCIKSTNHGLFLNVDACFNVFIQERELVSLLNIMFSERESNERSGRGEVRLPDEQHPFWRDASLLLKNCQVQTLHTNFPKKFKLSGILNKPANQITFSKDGEEITVAKYFESTYGRLKYPEYPVAIVKKQGKESFFPIEVLKITENQKYTRKLNENQTAEMIKHAAKIPTDRFSFIAARVKDLKINENDTLKDFNLVIDSNFLECKGKILSAPEIIFGNEKRNAELNKGQVNIQRVRFFDPKGIKKFSIISLAKVDKQNLDNEIRSLSSFGRSYGVEIPTNYSYSCINSPSEYEAVLKKEQPDLALVVLPSKSSSIYNKVKAVAETYFGVITQCILSKNLNKLTKPPFAANILLKINAKIGGTNMAVNNKLINRPTMLIGADVSHPGIGDLESPSIVGIVSSYEKTLTKYNTYILTQEKKSEIIADLNNVIKKSLISFHKHNNIEPEKIIYFRDGVGDSQFYDVFATEYKAIKEACLSYKKGYTPEVNLIVVQKRHNLKFLLGSESSGLRGGLIDKMSKLKVSEGLKGGYQERRGGGYDRRDDRRGGGYERRDDNRGGYERRGGGFDRRQGGDDNKGNVSPGTVVEEIGHPFYYDFYMVSHYALQGTARPIRYQVLVNESNFSNDDLQQFIHNMSYSY
ncbi:hypothetical protein H312_02661, partial [Anncaliia algerae PRA339]